jgi:hypothetical protein
LLFIPDIGSQELEGEATKGGIGFGDDKAIYKTINCGEKPLQIFKVCATRWLSIEPTVSRILDQW